MPILILASTFACKQSQKSTLTGVACQTAKRISFEDDILSFKYKDNYVHIRNKEKNSSKLTIHERLEEAKAFVEVGGRIKEMKLLVEPVDDLFIVIRTPDNSLHFKIQVFERIKFGEKKLTMIVPMEPKIVEVSSRDTSIDAITIELLTGEWWEKEFEYLAHVEAKAKLSNGMYRKLMGGFCPVGFSPTFSAMGTGMVNNGRGGSGSCHAVITANITSRILATKGILQPDEIIHPSFWSFHYWTDMKGGNLNDIVNDELRKIEQLKADIKAGRISKDPIKLRNHIKLQVMDEQAGLPNQNIDLMNRTTQLPIVKRSSLNKTDYSAIINLTNSLTDLRASMVLDGIKSNKIPKSSLTAFFEQMNRLKKDFIKSHNHLLDGQKLSSTEVEFTNIVSQRKKFYKALENGPVVANFNGHAITALKKHNNEIKVFDSLDMLDEDLSSSIDASLFFNNLQSYFIISTEI